jgi:uncharacterized protein
MPRDIEKLSRRSLLSSSALALAGASLSAGAPPAHPVTSASVPDDPDAPGPQSGTQPERLPFAGELRFARTNSEPVVRAFELSDVQLLPGPFLTAQQSNQHLLQAMPAERLLYTFRKNAGLPSNAEPLAGWEKPDGELRGHYTGHFLSACALGYGNTQDRALKAKSDEIVHNLAECQAHLSGGYLSAFPPEFFDRLQARKPVWAPFYTIHKIMAGLLDAHGYTGNQQALEVLTRQAEWVDQWTARLSPEAMQMVLDTEYGGMNELLYNLAATTGDDRWGRVGDRFTKQRFFNPLALRQDQLRGLHTNTHIPQVIGAARRYELTSDARFGAVADFFWSEVTAARTYATGGTSNNEGWLVSPYQLAKELSLGTDTNECCCAYNMLKLTRQLYTWSADPRFFDYYERVLWNHRLGTIDAQTGLTQYYLGIAPGSWRTFGTEFSTFWCCNGTGVEEFAKLSNSIYFRDNGGLYVNLFIPSTVHWKEKGLRLTQQTRFPEEAATAFHIELEQPGDFALHLRIPSWLPGSPSVRLNGKTLPVSARPGSYLSLSRQWKSGDRVELALPLSLRVEAMPDDPGLQAFLYGPIVLAGELPDAVPSSLVHGRMGPDFKKVAAPQLPAIRSGGKSVTAWLRPGRSALQFETAELAASSGLRFSPFWQTGGDRRYSIYWRVV